MATHGDISEVTYNHPTIGAGIFTPQASQSNTYDLGGIRTNDDATQVAGNGALIAQKNRMRGMFEIVVEDDKNTREDARIAGELAAHPVPADWTFTTLSGVVYAGTGFPVGDIQPDLNAGTFTLKVAAGFFEKIAG